MGPKKIWIDGYFTIPNKDVYSIFADGTSWNNVHPGDKMFYSFKPINAKTDYYDNVSLLSYGEDNSEIIRNYEPHSIFHNPPFLVKLDRNLKDFKN